MQRSTTARLIKEFAQAANGGQLPERPRSLTEEEVFFISRMVLSELFELNRTVTSDQSSALMLLNRALGSLDLGGEPFSSDPATTIANQADSFADMIIYILDTAAKRSGVNCDAIIDLAHKANMAKRDPATGQFIRRADGKIEKPAGWQAPDVKTEIERQIREGTWSIPSVNLESGLFGPCQ